MSEKLKTHEHGFDHKKESREAALPRHKAEHEPKEEAKWERSKAENLEKARDVIHELEPGDSENLTKSINSPDSSSDEPYYSKEQLNKVTLLNNLSVVRSSLSKTNKSFSKLIHQPLIDNVSEISAKYLIRPMAMLCGGLFTLIGSLGYYILLKNTGYKYNYFVSLLFFICGFIFGLAVELISRKVHLGRKSH